MKAVEGGEGRAMLIVPLPSGAVSMSVMLPAVPEVGAAPAERGCRSHFAALIWRRESEICQLPVEAQRTLGAFFRQQQRALHLCVVLRDRQEFRSECVWAVSRGHFDQTFYSTFSGFRIQVPS